MGTLPYYDDLTFVSANHLADCQVVINTQFSDFAALNYLESGTILFSHDDGPTQRVTGPALYWTWQEPVWRYRSVGDAPWMHWWVAFRGPRLQRFIDGGLFPRLQHPRVQLKAKEPVHAEMQQLVRMVLRHDPRDHPDCVQILERILLTAQRARSVAKENTRSPRDFDKIAEMIAAEPFRNWHFPQVAEEFGMSYSYFRGRFRSHLQVAPHAYLQRCRILKVASELDRGEPIQAVAREHGYHDLGNFCRLFTRVMGVSPRQYVRGLPPGA